MILNSSIQPYHIEVANIALIFSFVMSHLADLKPMLKHTENQKIKKAIQYFQFGELDGVLPIVTY